MEIVGTAKKVTIYIGESDRWAGKPLYMAILEVLKAADCAGATVTRGIAGFGAHSRIRTATIVDLSSDLPLIVEWVDDPARVERVMPTLVEMVAEGMITCSEVEVVTYGHRELRRLQSSAPVHDLMSREVRSVRPDTSVADAVEMLIGKAYKALPVVDDERRVVGILTDGDVLRRLELPDAGVQSALTRAELGRELEALRHSGQTVQDIMVRPVVTTTDDAPVAKAVKVMTQRAVKRLPVVDRDGRLIGVVSRVDVLRALVQPAVAEAPQPELRPGHHVQVRDVMVTNVPKVHVDDGLNKVVDLLVSSAERRIMVVDTDDRVLGIITDGDLIKRASGTERTGLLGALSRRLTGSEGVNLAARTAGEVMTANPVTVTPDTRLLDALQLLLQHKVKRLPVVDEAGRLAGLVGRGDILQALAAELPES
jgi:CBS domain-containing protein